MTNSPEPVSPAVMMNVGIQGRPDGTAWVCIQINTPFDAYNISFSPEQALEIADKLPEGLRNASQEATRKTSGLILPNQEGIITHE